MIAEPFRHNFELLSFGKCLQYDSAFTAINFFFGILSILLSLSFCTLVPNPLPLSVSLEAKPYSRIALEPRTECKLQNTLALFLAYMGANVLQLVPNGGRGCITVSEREGYPIVVTRVRYARYTVEACHIPFESFSARLHLLLRKLQVVADTIYHSASPGMNTEVVNAALEVRYIGSHRWYPAREGGELALYPLSYTGW